MFFFFFAPFCTIFAVAADLDLRNTSNKMTNETENYSQLSDLELVDRLMSKPADEKLHDFFLVKICRRILRRISLRLFNHDDDTQLWGEFYEFISKDDWMVLRKWESKNGASLATYLSYCATNYFVHGQLVEKRLGERLVYVSSQEEYERLADVCDEEEEMCYTDKQVRDAFNALNERDQTILQELVIDGHNVMEAAPVIWEYIKSDRPLCEMEPKRVQCTIAMAKSRAQLALFNALRQVRALASGEGEL